MPGIPPNPIAARRLAGRVRAGATARVGEHHRDAVGADCAATGHGGVEGEAHWRRRGRRGLPKRAARFVEPPGVGELHTGRHGDRRAVERPAERRRGGVRNCVHNHAGRGRGAHADRQDDRDHQDSARAVRDGA